MTTDSEWMKGVYCPEAATARATMSAERMWPCSSRRRHPTTLSTPLDCWHQGPLMMQHYQAVTASGRSVERGRMAGDSKPKRKRGGCRAVVAANLFRQDRHHRRRRPLHPRRGRAASRVPALQRQDRPRSLQCPRRCRTKAENASAAKGSRCCPLQSPRAFQRRASPQWSRPKDEGRGCGLTPWHQQERPRLRS